MKRSEIVPWLLGRLRARSWLLFVSLCAALIGGLIPTIDPLLMRHWIDVTLPPHQLLSSIVIGKVLLSSLMMTLLIALCFVATAAVGALGSLVSFRVGQQLGQDLRVELLSHMTRLSADWHERTFLGEKLSRIEQDVEQVAQYGADALNTILRSLILFCVYLSIMFTLNWRIALSTLPVLPLFLWVRSRFRFRVQLRADEARSSIGRASGNIAELLDAVPQLQMLRAEPMRIQRAVEAWSEMVIAQWQQRKTEVMFSIAVPGVLAVAIFAVLGFGGYEYLVGALSLGSLLAFYTYATRIFQPVTTAMEFYSRSQRMLASARRIRDVLDTPPGAVDEGTLEHLPVPLTRGLAYISVCFAYGDGRQVLRDISFCVNPGERVALIGKSGSGKSTLARLLVRIAEPSSGEITLEGAPTTDYSLRSLRGTIAYVPQHPVLFSGTIRDNLLYGNPDAGEIEIERAVEATQLRGVLNRLPAGLDTVLGPEASRLSGGERQRMAIARALLCHSAVLLLDESTSALDMPTEQALLRSIADFNSDQGMLIISHRLRSLSWVDRIVVLNAGRIVAQGTHDVLYRDSPLYRTLYAEEGNELPSPSALREAVRH